MTTLSRSHLINARTLRKRQYLRSETVRTQPNLHVPSVLVVQVLWLPCHKTIYEISSRKAHANGLRRHIISKKSLLDDFSHSFGFHFTMSELLLSHIIES